MQTARIGSTTTCVALCLACGCGAASLPEPPRAPQPPTAYRQVPFPPPAALVEVVPPSPRTGAVWVDGSWLWRTEQWVWDRGGWVVPNDGTRLSRWDLRYLMDGTLLFAPGSWRTPSGQEVPPPNVLAPADPPPQEATPANATAP